MVVIFARRLQVLFNPAADFLRPRAVKLRAILDIFQFLLRPSFKLELLFLETLFFLLRGVFLFLLRQHGV